MYFYSVAFVVLLLYVGLFVVTESVYRVYHLGFREHRQRVGSFIMANLLPRGLRSVKRLAANGRFRIRLLYTSSESEQENRLMNRTAGLLAVAAAI